MFHLPLGPGMLDSRAARGAAPQAAQGGYVAHVMLLSSTTMNWATQARASTTPSGT